MSTEKQKKPPKLGEVQAQFVAAMQRPRAQVWSDGSGYKVTYEGQKGPTCAPADSVAGLIKKGVVALSADGIVLVPNAEYRT